jgi:Tfp pilus assembly protein PilF
MPAKNTTKKTSAGKRTESAGSGEAWPWHAAALLLPLLAFGLYRSCLHGAFVYDDPNAITQSTLILSLTPLHRFVTMSTRPLTDFSFAVDYAVSQFNPGSYHLTNVLLHGLNAVLAYALAWLILGTPWLVNRYGRQRGAIAWVAAALFTVHPLASEAVAYVSSRSELLVATFMLSALVSYAVACSERPPLGRAFWAAAVVLCVAAALASKEIAVTLPVLLLLYDWCFLAGGDWRRTRPRWGMILLSATPLIAGGLFFVGRAVWTSNFNFGHYADTAGFGFRRFGPGQYLMTQFGVIAHYLRLVIVPVGQTFDYDWDLARSFWSPEVLLPLAFLVALVTVALRKVRSRPVFAFAILMMFVVLAPTSSVLPIADLAVERRMYIPLVGFGLLGSVWACDLTAAWLRRKQRSPAPARRAAWIALAAIPLLVFSTLTVARARLWGDPVALHEDGVAKAPKNPRVRLNLGVTYMNLGRLDEAEKQLQVAKRLYDSGQSLQAFTRIGAFIHYNLGAILFLRSKYEESAVELRRALELGGQYLALRPMAFYILAQIAARKQQWGTAIKRYEAALKIDKRNADWHAELAFAFLMNGQRAKARRSAQLALRLQPKHPGALKVLAQLNRKS